MEATGIYYQKAHETLPEGEISVAMVNQLRKMKHQNSTCQNDLSNKMLIIQCPIHLSEDKEHQ